MFCQVDNFCIDLGTEILSFKDLDGNLVCLILRESLNLSEFLRVSFV